MIKPEWGTKRSCPKCATRFYDLEKADPVTCIECGYAWEPEPILKSKQPLPFEVAKPEAIFEFYRERGFDLRKMVTCAGGQGCNEFVFAARE